MLIIFVQKLKKIKQKIFNKIFNILNQYILFKSQIIDPKLLKKDQIQVKYKNHSIKDYRSTLDIPARIILKKWGGRNPSFYNYDQSSLDSLSTRLKVFTGSPEVKKFYNVIYMPQYCCLYSSSGLRINYSCLYRGLEKSELVTKAPHKINPPKQLKVISQKFIYIGEIVEHYGHFLTESISRLWYAVKDQEYPILCFGLSERNKLQKTFIDLFFKSIELDKNRFISFKNPIFLKEVIIPYPSFSNRCESFEVHKLLPENVAEYFLAKNLKTTSQPLYFSRKYINQNKRLIINESKLEEKLYENGFAICYPEKISIRQQIHLINKHEVIIGTTGSALHNILFDISSQRNLVCFADKKYHINTNYLMIDAIKSVNSVYIAALQKDTDCLKVKHSTQNRFIDLNIAISSLKKINLI